MNIITISHREKHFVPAENIMKMEAAGSYTVLHEKAGKSYVLCTNLGQLLKQLHRKDALKKIFFRVNRSCVVNMNEITCYQRGRGGKVVLSNDAVIAVATRRKSELLKLLKKLK